MSGQASALGGCVLMEDIAYLLGAVVGDFDTDMGLICREGCAESFLLTLREPITRGAQEIADLIEGIACASTVSGRVLLDTATHLNRGITGERDDVKGVEHAGGVLDLAKRWRSCCPWKGSSVAIWVLVRESSPRSVSQFLRTVPDLPGTRSTQAGRGMILPSCQVYDAGERVWAPAASVLVVPHMLVNPQHPHACETSGVIRCGLQTRLDMGPHGVPRSCQLSSQSCNGGSLET